MLRVVVAGEQENVVVGPSRLARIDAVRRHPAGQRLCTIAHRRLAAARVLDKGAARVLQLGVLHRDLHPAAAAGRLALKERTQYADRQQHAGAGVAQGRTRLARTPVALPGNRHRAAAGLSDHVEGEVVLVGAALAEPFDLRVDEARVQRMEVLPAEPQPLDRAGGEVFDEDIGLLGHFFDEGEAALRLEVDGDGLLVGIVDHEIIGVGPRLRTAPQYAAWLAALRVLHLDDLGAEPGKRLGAGLAGLELREIENPNPVEAVRRYAHFVHRSSAPWGKFRTPTIGQSGFWLKRLLATPTVCRSKVSAREGRSDESVCFRSLGLWRTA